MDALETKSHRSHSPKINEESTEVQKHQERIAVHNTRHRCKCSHLVEVEHGLVVGASVSGQRSANKEETACIYKQ